MTNPSIVLYGIKNCDTVKKARKWLEKNGVDYRFHDFREDGMGAVPLEEWINSFGWQEVLNRRSTSWRALADEQKNTMDDKTALATASDTPTLIKRPVTIAGGETRFGFKEAEFAELVK
ncbi:transcriptional regulator, Spx/MgsR family [Microbulbifer donghaiensis]|uniref:Transcriptional regulator, Spx/MgsR family n=1 Tax=Microbulbifer donghaiensis TaxID=494016 RepID=A0A1M4WWP4_9GAMM|nr:ArsC family reductase [Microbulbifer donghaiensis]SHE85402.1 transcriptional regulator, Spx/MgsR family [Microbulbifer donghaiensis]